MKTFKTDNLTVGYGQRAILGDLQFEAVKGKIIAVLGANGSGKSTALRSICGLLPILQGAIYLDELDLHNYTSEQLSRELAVVLTDNRVETEFLTVRDMVSLGRYPYTSFNGKLTAADEAVIDDALMTVGIGDLAESELTKLSDGQRQKVLLARALTQATPLIILDEPTGFLDLGSRHELMGILRRLVREKQIAVILSTHDLDLVLKYCDVAMLVGSGKVLSCGAVEEVLTAENVAALYNLKNIRYSTDLGNTELSVAGKPEVFVIGGNGSATAIYRSLVKEGRCFATGILATNDLDYYTASAMGSSIISIAPYTPISDSDVIAARLLMQQCREVIVADGCPEKSLQILS